ncbi:MAG: hypothetical protein COY58_04240 [Gammaproteobacteria bacterium CG_4_10_14_0_8_um_filter_38_16]|nr:MAG: hypothetical protein COY58_04240 [Gammaproteobacteria bacterium CG_4_10_14_0_8_um_filter_38_16]PJA03297.1 MAG: hypothetical protein COX72_05915 [Gammaproteobacteria bacterium CG_4_10_14_0_2_um_filter_38_22]PJB10342.1 MAG: hypothetical protein CO120_05425 [Gammaproteobacteria bacterium CG_4_9_14_3_um_filter_38_9]
MMLIVVLLFSSVMTYRYFIYRYRVSAWINHFVGALHYARMTAMTSQVTVTLCARKKNNQCGLHWQKGQVIFNQKNQHVYRVLSAIPSGYRLFWKSTLSQSDALRWRADGFTRGQQGSFLLCADKHQNPFSAKIIILRTGRIRSEMGEIPDCK